MIVIPAARNALMPLRKTVRHVHLVTIYLMDQSVNHHVHHHSLKILLHSLVIYVLQDVYCAIWLRINVQNVLVIIFSKHRISVFKLVV